MYEFCVFEKIGKSHRTIGTLAACEFLFSRMIGIDRWIKSFETGEIIKNSKDMIGSREGKA